VRRQVPLKIVLPFVLCFCLTASAQAKAFRTSANLAGLKQDQQIADFSVSNLYSDATGAIIGAKFLHLPTGAPVFFFQIETVPQAFMWVDTPADPKDANRGLPHALEHLLAGKGTKGRYLSLLRDLRFGSTTAATYFDYNFYSFSTGAGLNAFFDEFHAYLDALYRPDFTDTEAEREFYHWAVASGSAATKPGLSEQGTVYDEMLADQDVDRYYDELNKLTLGDQNPLGFTSGGVPDEMRSVTPEEIRKFHARHYRISPTTGFIFVLDPKEDVSTFLKRVSTELSQFSPSSDPVRTMTKGCNPKYPIHPSGSMGPALYQFPSRSEADPGEILLAWKPAKTESALATKLLELLLHGLAGGEQSLLYKSLVGRKTRQVDAEAKSVDGNVFLRESPCLPVARVGISGVPGNRISSEELEMLRNHVSSEIKKISEYPDHSKRLLAFNQTIASYVKAQQRSEKVWIRTSPRFGDSLQTRWKEHLEKLEADNSFVRSMSEEPTWRSIMQQLGTGKNIWSHLIRDFHLLDTPYATASTPSPQLLDERAREKQDRVRSKIKDLMRLYHTNDEQQAIAKFQEDELVKTKEIDAIATRVPAVHVLDHPPLTPDDGIRYKQFSLHRVPVVASVFQHPSTIDVGLSFDLNHVPRKYYPYLPILPSCIDSLGLRTGQRLVSYSQLRSQIEHTLYTFSTEYEANPRTRRADFSIRGSTTSRQELGAALRLIRQMTTSNNLDASNLDRLRDLVEQRVSADDSFATQNESGWAENAELALRYQSNELYLALQSQFTRAHWDERLKWRLHPPVDIKEIDLLSQYAENTLASFSDSSRKDVSARLASLDVKGLDAELVAYWKKNLFSFADAQLVDGLRRLTAEVREDLKIGPSKTIKEIRDLQRIVLNRNVLHAELMVSQAGLHDIAAQLERFLDSVPVRRFQVEGRPQIASDPINQNARQRYPHFAEHFPYYVGFVNANSVTASALFSADFPGYSQVDVKSLTESLASRVFGGGGPHSFYMKGLEAGFAYNNGISGRLGSRTLNYFVDRSTDLPSLISLVNSLAAKLPDGEDQSVRDYVLSSGFPSPRTGSTFSERGLALERDLREGNTPAIIRRHSEAILRLAKDPQMLPRIMRFLPATIAPVLLEPERAPGQETARSIFFIVASEATLSDVEQRLHLPSLLRLWPSDYWIE
jgi:Zn-dependent M16 (insulinase) family peptidase